MKKIFALLGITLMALTTVQGVLAVVAGDDNSTGSITYQTGGVKNPAKILAIWEINSNQTLDQNLLKRGCQVNPPMAYGQYSTVWVYVAFNDPDNDITDLNQIKFDIYWPNNNLRSGLGNGSKKTDNVEPVYWATWNEFVTAHNIDNGSNYPFICYYDGAKDGYGLEEFNYVQELYYDANSVKFAKIEYNLYYHDPAGWYTANVTVQGTYIDSKANLFEYVLLNGIEFDFSYVNWGSENQLNIWYNVDGDRNFSTPAAPTVRNIGDWDSRIGANFTHGTFNPNDVSFNIRMGDTNPASSHYNQSYLEKTGSAILPDNDYIPMPISNYNELQTHSYDNALLKCHVAKIIFYLKPTQWTTGPGTYTFNIEMYSEIPSWMPHEASYFPYPGGSGY